VKRRPRLTNAQIAELIRALALVIKASKPN
jgi:hypothetical protein